MITLGDIKTYPLDANEPFPRLQCHRASAPGAYGVVLFMSEDEGVFLAHASAEFVGDPYESADPNFTANGDPWTGPNAPISVCSSA